nr:hypothetical protein [Bacteroidaceae bacterium]
MKDIEKEINWYKNNGGFTYKNFCDVFLPRIGIEEFLNEISKSEDDFIPMSLHERYNQATKIAAIYEHNKTMEDLTKIHKNDVLILLVYVRENKNINPKDDDVRRRIKANIIEQLLTGIIKRAINLEIKLPQDFIEKYGNIDIRFKTFAELINNLYTGTAEQNKYNEFSFLQDENIINIFKKATEKGYMTYLNDRYIWKKDKGTKLAVLLGVIHCQDYIYKGDYFRGIGDINWKVYEKYFKLKDLNKKRCQIYK